MYIIHTPSHSSIYHSMFLYLRKFEFFIESSFSFCSTKQKSCKRVQKCLSIVLCTYNYQIVSTRTKTDVIFYRYECIISAFHLKVAILSKGNHISALKLLIFMQAYFSPSSCTHIHKRLKIAHIYLFLSPLVLWKQQEAK